MPQTASSSLSTLLNAIDSRQQQARDANQRLLVVASGEPSWGRALAESVWQRPQPNTTGRRRLVDNPQEASWSALTQAAHWLGQEHGLLIIDTHHGFDADAFGAISGTLVGGGLLLMLVPPLVDWPEQTTANPFGPPPSRFIQHLVSCIEQDPAVLLIQEPGQSRMPSREYTPAASDFVPPPCRTRDQQQAVEALTHLGESRSPVPLVITSDRGRGKSSALGIAAANLLRAHPGLRIGLCAPRPGASSTAFERAATLLEGATTARNRLEYAGGSLRFLAPDALLAERPPLELLLVDEAAALPLPVLEGLLQHYPRIAFASTVHGYEGTGRGFALRFAGRLDSQAPGWQSLVLEQPVRWQNDDPLESFVFNALLLDAEPADPDPPPTVDSRRFVELDRTALLERPGYLRQLFGLLVLAHYRTRPADLYRLLDDPGLRLYVLEDRDRPLAVALVGFEGGFEPATAEAIYRGYRRPPGHLLAQSLAFHAGVPDAARHRYARILRLAVHPALQRRGLGSLLLTNLIEALQSEHQLDALGASFSASAELMPFWQRAGLLPVRVGLTREHTSGQHAVQVLKPLSETGQYVYRQARQRLEQHWATLRAGPLQDLPVDLAGQLGPAEDIEIETALNPADRKDIDSFVNGRRGYEVCAWPIEKLITALLDEPALAGQLEQADRALLRGRVLAKQDWPTLCARFKLEGQKAARRRLREAVSRAWQLWENQ